MASQSNPYNLLDRTMADPDLIRRERKRSSGSKVEKKIVAELHRRRNSWLETQYGQQQHTDDRAPGSGAETLQPQRHGAEPGERYLPEGGSTRAKLQKEAPEK